MDSIVGSKIGIFKVIDICKHRAKDRHILYRVKCMVCGREFDMKLANIGRAKKCTHNKNRWNTRSLSCIYNTIIRRCFDVKDKDYKYYGAKGITVCDAWLTDPNSFENWAINNGYKKGLSIDRIDPQKGYFPENCRWITREENSRRAGKVNWITVNGETLTGRQWAEKLGLGLQRINKYIKSFGLNKTIILIENILNNPDKLKNKKTNESIFRLYNIN